jgi:hypothetical protein
VIDHLLSDSSRIASGFARSATALVGTWTAEAEPTSGSQPNLVVAIFHRSSIQISLDSGLLGKGLTGIV